MNTSEFLLPKKLISKMLCYIMANNSAISFLNNLPALPFVWCVNESCINIIDKLQLSHQLMLEWQLHIGSGLCFCSNWNLWNMWAHMMCSFNNSLVLLKPLPWVVIKQHMSCQSLLCWNKTGHLVAICAVLKQNRM